MSADINSGTANSAGDEFTSGSRDFRSRQEKRGSAQEHYGKDEVQNNTYESDGAGFNQKYDAPVHKA